MGDMSGISGMNNFDSKERGEINPEIKEAKQLAAESSKIEKARKKLEKQFEMHGKITPEDLQKALNTISRKLHNTSYPRVAVERFSMGSLFDKNSTSALPSAKVEMLAKNILARGSSAQEALVNPKGLMGRVDVER